MGSKTGKCKSLVKVIYLDRYTIMEPNSTDTASAAVTKTENKFSELIREALSLPALTYVEITGIVLIIINLLFLDYFAVLHAGKPAQVKTSLIPNNISSTPQTISGQSGCSSCAAQVDLALNMIKKIQADLSVTPVPLAKAATPMPTSKPLSPPLPTLISSFTAPTAAYSGVKEYYVPLGSGSGMGSDWTDVPGMRTSIDTSLYPPIKTVTFEVSAHTPTGNEVVYLRLYDDTDSTPVANSDLTWNGGATQNLISSPIQLASGNKVYKVQIETQLQYTSDIDSAKVHIILY